MISSEEFNVFYCELMGCENEEEDFNDSCEEFAPVDDNGDWTAYIECLNQDSREGEEDGEEGEDDSEDGDGDIDAEVEAMFAQYDEDGDETICLTEFTDMYGDYVGTHEGIEAAAEEMHMQYDVDGDGALELYEFKALYEDQVGNN